jgi:hypothetical protein
VLGADSTTTFSLGSGEHHFNYGQKLFEVGAGGTLGIVTWGLGNLHYHSYRRMIAELADDLDARPPSNAAEAADRWTDHFWAAYTSVLAPEIAALQAEAALKSVYDPTNPNDPNARTFEEEMDLLERSNNLTVGFCLGGYVKADRTPAAYEIVFQPLSGKPIPGVVPLAQSFWGQPATINRLINGCSDEARASIFLSPHWHGSWADLDAVIAPHKYVHPRTMPIREAIDFTHSCLLTTVKSFKFSDNARLCGGPIEMAVITADRPFRWVQHKELDAAMRESEP